MSRPMKSDEIASFEKAFGYKPVGIPTSIDMLAVYVHKDNPIPSLTLQQVDAIFSKTRNGGHEQDLVTWGDLGLTGEWAAKPISLYGRNSASGTYGYFKEHALFKGDYKDSVKEQPGSSSVVQGVASDKYAMGYSGIGYMTADVRAVPLAKDGRSKAVEAKPENAYSGTYPMARFLYVYVNYKPGTQLDPLRREFVRYVLSQRGQADVVKDGYFPLPAKIAGDALVSVGLSMPVIDAGADKPVKSEK
jgi:phosphate transport system substrate-binding protein